MPSGSSPITAPIWTSELELVHVVGVVPVAVNSTPVVFDAAPTFKKSSEATYVLIRYRFPVINNPLVCAVWLPHLNLASNPLRVKNNISSELNAKLNRYAVLAIPE